jgi:hypothetical protein
LNDVQESKGTGLDMHYSIMDELNDNDEISVSTKPKLTSEEPILSEEPIIKYDTTPN